MAAGHRRAFRRVAAPILGQLRHEPERGSQAASTSSAADGRWCRRRGAPELVVGALFACAALVGAPAPEGWGCGSESRGP